MPGYSPSVVFKSLSQGFSKWLGHKDITVNRLQCGCQQKAQTYRSNSRRLGRVRLYKGEVGKEKENNKKA